MLDDKALDEFEEFINNESLGYQRLHQLVAEVRRLREALKAQKCLWDCGYLRREIGAQAQGEWSKAWGLMCEALGIRLT
jgi:hypothetical protein